MKLLTFALVAVVLASSAAPAQSPYGPSQPPRRILFAARSAEQLPPPRSDAEASPQPYTYHPQLQKRVAPYSPYSMIRYDGQPAAAEPTAEPDAPVRPAPARPAGRARHQSPEFLPPPVLGSP